MRRDGVVLVPRGDDEPGVYRSGVLGRRRRGRRCASPAGGAGPTLTRLDAAPAARPGRDRARPRARRRRLERRGARRRRRRARSSCADFDPRRPFWLDAEARRASRTTRSGCWTRAGSRRTTSSGATPSCPAASRSTRRLRAVLRDAPDTLGDPFTREGAEQLLAWAAGPADRGSQWGLTRYLGRAVVAAPRPLALVRRPRDRRRRALRALGRRERPAGRAGRGARAVAAGHGQRPFGVNVAGYLSSTLGTAEAARLYMTALRAADVPLRMESLDPPRPPRTRTTEGSTPPSRPVPRTLDAPVDYALNLVTVNAIQLPQFARQLGEDFFAGKPTVGVWAWETSVIPASWAPAFEWVDEIWTHSTYMAGLIAPRSPVPVVAVPPPVRRPRAGGRAARARRHPGRLLVPVRVRLPARRSSARTRSGLVEAFTRRVRERRRPAARPEGVQRRLQARAARAAALRRPRPRRHPPRRPLDDRRAAPRAGRARRLLRLAAPLGGLRADDGRGDGAGQARDRHGLLRQPRLHGRDHGLPGRPRADRGRPRRRHLPRRRDLGRARPRPCRRADAARRRAARGGGREGRSRPRGRAAALLARGHRRARPRAPGAARAPPAPRAPCRAPRRATRPSSSPPARRRTTR